MSRDSSRKPSSSSTRSGTHSPTPSPGIQPHSGRRITPTTTGNMLSVGVAGGTGLMSYSSGWEMWGSGAPSQRNPSLSSPVNTSDIPPSQGDSGYRGPIREGWTSSSRPASGMRDEDVTQSPHLKDFSQSHEAPTPLSLHSSRHRQGSAAPFSAPGSDNQPAKLSPQGYDLNLNRESSPRYSSASSTFTSAPYSASHSTHSQPPPPTGASGYETLVSPAVDDLSLRFRGMAVEDDFSVRQRGHPPPPSMLPNLMQRPQHPMHTARPPYNNYPPAFSEYSYGPGYDHRPMDPNVYGSPPLNNASYSNVPTLVPTHGNDIHHHHPNSVFYDFPPPRPPASQYYYPPQQGVIFPPNTSPMVPAQLPALPTSFDKKRELSYNLNMQQQQHQLMAQALMFPRITPSPPLPLYTNVMDYSQLPLMMPGGPLYDANMAVALYHSMQQGAQSLRSPILEEFRINKTRRWELRDIAGHVVEFSGDQHGSRFIQQKLETASSDEKQKVFDEIVPNNILQLIQDVFGNYVIQKMFEHGTQLQKTRLAAEMDGRVLALSKQMYGCRVVQKAIECVLPEQQAAIVHELEPHIMECIHDGNGNHVVQKMIERVPPERLGFVHSFRGNVQVLAGHMYGCRVLQRAFEYLPEVMIVPLIDELHACTLTLMRNQFGNYVMQFMIEHGKAQDRALVIAKLRGQILNMARHKFASNVCEKALTFADPETRRSFIDEIITPRPEGVTVLSMIKDQYANYVLQRAVVVAEVDQRETLIRQIRSQLVTLRRFSHGYNKHLVSIEKLLQKYAPK